MLPYLSIVRLNVGPIIIQTWGLFAALGFVATLWISLREAKGKNIDSEIIWNVMIISLPGMIVGSRILYFFSNPTKNINTLLDPHAGFSLLGGAVAAGILSFVYLQIRKQNFRRIFDVLTPGAAISLVFVRIGCLLISDHIGRITAVPWGMYFLDGSMRHPVALYHIFFLLLISLIIFHLKSGMQKDGALFFYFCVLYTIFIFTADLFRCNDLPVCDAHSGIFTYTQWALLAFLFLSPFARRFFISAEPAGKL